MPTYTWTRTKEQVTGMILRKLGILGAQDVAGAEDAAVVDEAINARLKELNALRIMWWNVAGAQTSYAVTGGVATFSITALDYLFPVSLSLVSGTEQRVVEIIDHRRYQAIPNKAQTGDVEMAYFAGATVYMWPVPSASTTAKLTYEAIAEDVATTAAVDVPVGGIRALVDLVAGDLVDEYSTPAGKAARLVAKQEPALKTLRMIAYQRTDTATVEAEYF